MIIRLARLPACWDQNIASASFCSCQVERKALCLEKVSNPDAWLKPCFHRHHNGPAGHYVSTWADEEGGDDMAALYLVTCVHHTARVSPLLCHSLVTPKYSLETRKSSTESGVSRALWRAASVELSLRAGCASSGGGGGGPVPGR